MVGLNPYAMQYHASQSRSAALNLSPFAQKQSTISSISALQGLQGVSSQQTTAQQDRLTQMKEYLSKASTFNTGMSEAMGDLKTAAQRLKSFSQESVFRPVGYGSSNGDVLQVTGDSTFGSGATRPAVEVKVDQVATAQVSQSQKMASTDKNLAALSGLTLSDGKKTVNLKFDFKADTNNKTALAQIAESVNKSGLNLTASVVEKDGNSSLQLVAKETGTKSAFTATAQVSGQDNNTLLAMQTTQKSQNAIYTVNGGEQKESQSNSVAIDGKITATLKAAGSTTVKAQNTANNKDIISAAKDFATQYNNALSFTNKNSGLSSAVRNLANSLENTKFSASGLAKVGIEVGRDGKLSVNEATMTKALTDNPTEVERALGGTGSIGDTAYQKASSAIVNQRNFFPPPQALSAQPQTYSRVGAYNAVYNAGMIMNMLA